MYIPGFTPEKMSDDELLSRYSDLGNRILYFASTGASSEIIEQLSAMQTAVIMEQRERAQREVFLAKMKDQKAVVESDPDLAPEPQQPKKGGGDRRQPMQKMHVMRSKQPSNIVQAETPTAPPTTPKDDK